MKHLVFFSLLVLQLLTIPIKNVQAQENSDWWHTDYENQTAVGGSAQSPSTTTETLPVAGTAEVTYAVLVSGLGLIAIGIYLKKKNQSFS